MIGRRLLFWGAVGGVSLIAPFALNLAVDKIPVRGLRRFRDYIFSTTPGVSA